MVTLTTRLFRWCCPQCDTTLALTTGEERDDRVRGVDAEGWTSFEPRCPFCQTFMVDEDTIAAWYMHAHDVPAGKGFTLGVADFAEWRAAQPKVAHAENCDVYDREEKPCGCGADSRR